jgi:hypothetical protein
MATQCKYMHIAPGSKRTYSDHWRQLERFCEAFDLDPLRLDETSLAKVVLYFVLGHSVNSVPSFLSALQKVYTLSGAGELPRTPAFKMFQAGLVRLFGAADEVVQIKAISFSEVVTILRSLSWDSPEDVCFGAQMLTAFFLALRTEDHTGGRLLWGDIFPQDDYVQFRLAPGKSTRVFRKVAVAARSDNMDVRMWLARLASFVPPSHRAPNCPVFVSFAFSRDGVRRFPPLSRQAFITRFKSAVREVLGFDPHLYAGYSLRRGGVTALLSAGVPPAVIKRHVGWAPMSDAINAYYDHSGISQMLLPTRALQ